MSDIIALLKSRWYYHLFYLAACATVLLVSFLANQSMSLAWYTVLLITALWGLFLFLDGYYTLRRLHALRKLIAITADIPLPKDPLAQELMLQLQGATAQIRELRESLSQKRTAQLDYYTLWVHQVKTPIAAMRLILQQTDDKNSGVLLGELFKIEQYADLALRYVRLNDIKSNTNISVCSLNTVCAAAVKKYALLFVYKNLGVNIDLPNITVPTDEQWLSFIVEQLISNAVKYTHKGGIKIYLQGEDLVIEDSGIGIRSEDIPRIFEKGYTGYNGRLDSRASGIGLYLCKRTADSLGIGLKIESTLGKGTRALLRLPKAQQME